VLRATPINSHAALGLSRHALRPTMRDENVGKNGDSAIYVGMSVLL
jgi:hypothetical protein